MKKTALITGASKGIGRELAHLFAKDGCDLVLVARSEKELNSLKVELEEKQGITVHTFIKDLCQPDAAQTIFDELKAIDIDVDYLVNNAGFGEVSGMNASQLVKKVRIASSTEVAKLGYRAMMKGKSTVIHGTQNKLAPFGIRFIPRKCVTRISAKIMDNSV